MVATVNDMNVLLNVTPSAFSNESKLILPTSLIPPSLVISKSTRTTENQVFGISASSILHTFLGSRGGARNHIQGGQQNNEHLSVAQLVRFLMMTVQAHRLDMRAHIFRSFQSSQAAIREVSLSGKSHARLLYNMSANHRFAYLNGFIIQCLLDVLI